VTAHPTAEWIAQQITEAFPWEEAPRYLIRDRGAVYGAVVTRSFQCLTNLMLRGPAPRIGIALGHQLFRTVRTMAHKACVRQSRSLYQQSRGAACFRTLASAVSSCSRVYGFAMNALQRTNRLSMCPVIPRAVA
jgi:hypothetical protein